MVFEWGNRSLIPKQMNQMQQEQVIYGHFNW
jgi:hypothetical protein